MTTVMERLDARVNDARKALEKAIAKRDDSINALIRAVVKIKEAQRAMARTEKRRNVERKIAKTARKGADARRKADGAVPTL